MGTGRIEKKSREKDGDSRKREKDIGREKGNRVNRTGQRRGVAGDRRTKEVEEIKE